MFTAIVPLIVVSCMYISKMIWVRHYNNIVYACFFVQHARLNGLTEGKHRLFLLCFQRYLYLAYKSLTQVIEIQTLTLNRMVSK